MPFWSQIECSSIDLQSHLALSRNQYLYVGLRVSTQTTSIGFFRLLLFCHRIIVKYNRIVYQMSIHNCALVTVKFRIRETRIEKVNIVPNQTHSRTVQSWNISDIVGSRIADWLIITPDIASTNSR
jgi:hypothetical protein